MLRYIELKTEFHHRGPAWIARVMTSRSGRTIYFDGKALKRMVGNSANLRRVCGLSLGVGLVCGATLFGRERVASGSLRGQCSVGPRHRVRLKTEPPSAK